MMIIIIIIIINHNALFYLIPFLKYSQNHTAYESTWKERPLFHVFLFYSFCRNKTDVIMQFPNIAGIGFINLVCKFFKKTNIFTPGYAFNSYKGMP